MARVSNMGRQSACTWQRHDDIIRYCFGTLSAGRQESQLRSPSAVLPPFDGQLRSVKTSGTNLQEQKSKQENARKSRSSFFFIVVINRVSTLQQLVVLRATVIFIPMCYGIYIFGALSRSSTGVQELRFLPTWDEFLQQHRRRCLLGLPLAHPWRVQPAEGTPLNSRARSVLRTGTLIYGACVQAVHVNEIHSNHNIFSAS